ncbi:UNVERIFIED_CONTAM: hypothetical protein Sradi_6985300 [Sesamum radiatum]|uniref:PORR domain-containing protein n=1 Tax=Sesamum radiatum TaxID=300843 RepID=A0AAW2JE78_SESRA
MRNTKTCLKSYPYKTSSLPQTPLHLPSPSTFSTASQRLHLNRGPAAFLCNNPIGQDSSFYRAIFKVWRELGLPDNFEDSVISSNSDIFLLQDGNEPNTHFLVLNDGEAFKDCLIPAVENWRVVECCKEDCSVDRTDLKYSFKQGFPPGMRLKKNFKAKVKE